LLVAFVLPFGAYTWDKVNKLKYRENNELRKRNIAEEIFKRRNFEEKKEKTGAW